MWEVNFTKNLFSGGTIMKRVLTLLFAIILITGIFSTAFAETEDGFQKEIIQAHEARKNYKAYDFKFDKPMSKQDVNEKIKIIQEEFSKNNKFTDADRKEALERATLVENIFKDVQNDIIVNQEAIISSALATSSYDENKAKLRAANFIEGILDINDGLTEIEIFTIGYTLANSARSSAASAYPNNTMLQDACRHFSTESSPCISIAWQVEY